MLADEKLGRAAQAEELLRATAASAVAAGSPGSPGGFGDAGAPGAASPPGFGGSRMGSPLVGPAQRRTLLLLCW